MIFDKVKSLPIICGIELISGHTIPAAGDPENNFYHSYPSQNATFTNVYFGKKSVLFSEKTSKTNAGYVYHQSLSIQFPSTDLNRSVRLEMFKKVQYVRMLLNTNQSLILGRNDYFQNKKPDVKIESNEKITKVIFNVKSIFPAGNLIPDLGAIGFPVDVPVDFFNFY